MEINMRHSHLDLTEDQKAYIEKKVEHLSKYCERVSDEATYVDIDVQPNKVKTSSHRISFQITMYVPHAVIRAEVYALTVEEATDLAIEKLKKQVERYKEKQHRRGKKGRWIPASTLEKVPGATEEYMNVIKITKRKKFSAEPMHEEEAIEQLELLGHTFFIFKNIDTGLYNVAYKRCDDTYGLIELEEDHIAERED